MSKERCYLIAMIMFTFSAFAQDVKYLSHKTEADTVFTSYDSLSIFSLIDSLLTLDELQTSQLALRLSYNSNVLSAGRTLGIENFGLAPGVSYYHTSGLYADASGYWSSDFDPSYYLTVVSLGYMHDFTSHFSVMGGYDHYFYNFTDDESYVPYWRTLSVTPIVEINPLVLSVNYSFYFGNQYAHRVMPGLGLQFEKRKILGIDRVSVSPAFLALWGNEIVLETKLIPQTQFPKRAL